MRVGGGDRRPPSGAALPHNDARGGVPLPILLLEIARRHFPCGIEHERSGVWHTIRASVYRSGLVEQTVLPDDRRALVGEEWERDSTRPREGGKRLDRVIAHADDGQTLLGEIGKTSLQLDELRPAVWSPIGRTVEHEQCASGSQQG